MKKRYNTMTEIRRRIVELNNKSRKGKYLYIKQKGTHGRYYKINKNENAEKVFLEALEKNKNKKKISEEINKGKTETTIDIHKTNGKKAARATSKALEKILVNKNASKEMTKNLHKIMSKISYTTIVEGINKKNGEYGVLATITEIGTEDPAKLVERYKEILVKNRVIGSGDTKTIEKQLSRKGTIKNLTVNIQHQGTIKSVRTRITIIN